MPPAFREKIQAQLKAENPKHHSDDPYTLSEISTAALFVLSCDHAGYSCRESTPGPVKREMLDMSKGYENLNINAIAEEVAKRIATLERQQASGGPNLPRLRSHHLCIFCSDMEHYLSNCPMQPNMCRRVYVREIVTIR